VTAAAAASFCCCWWLDDQSWNEFSADLVKKVPTKIDIGPVYSHDPRQRAKYARGEKQHLNSAAMAVCCGTCSPRP
jgi:hypothetical protein